MWDEHAMKPMPAPIAVAWAEYQTEARPFQKLHRLVDTYETVLKYVGVLAVQNFYAAHLDDTFTDVDHMIRERIARPMLGNWAGFVRDMLLCFAARESDLLSRELFLFHYSRFGTNPNSQKHFTDQGASGRLLTLRNRLAHGATLPDEESIALIAQHKTDMLTLLEKAAFLADLPLFYIERQADDGQCHAQPLMGTEYQQASPICLAAPSWPLHHVVVHNPATGVCLDLHPLLLYTECAEELAQWDERRQRIVGRTVCHQRKPLFYNDLRAEGGRPHHLSGLLAGASQPLQIPQSLGRGLPSAFSETRTRYTRCQLVRRVHPRADGALCRQRQRIGSTGPLRQHLAQTGARREQCARYGQVGAASEMDR
jgi:hypothetical protein